MPQNPVKTPLFVSQIKAGAGITRTPTHGTGPVTVTAAGATPAGTAANILTNAGTFTANGVTPVTVAATSVTANSQILITLKTVGGTVGAPHAATITPGTGFTVVSQASDTSVYNFTVVG